MGVYQEHVVTSVTEEKCESETVSHYTKNRDVKKEKFLQYIYLSVSYVRKLRSKKMDLY